MLEAAGVASLMASPLMVKGQVAGVVEIGARGARRFTLEDESLLVLMADRAGLAIEHARAYERELSNVEMLQRSLLPDRLPAARRASRSPPGTCPAAPTWAATGTTRSRSTAARVGVAMGDVVGHGIGAASLMGQLRHAMRAYALEGHSPAGVLDRLDRVVRSLDGGQMATLLYLVMEADHGTVRFASAGHVPPLVISPEGEARYLESAPNPPLGVFDTPEHSEIEHRARAGLDDRALHGRAGGGARRLDRPGPRGAPARGVAGPMPPGRAVRPPGGGDARDPPGARRHRRAGAARAADRAAAAAPGDPVGPDEARRRCAATWAAGCARRARPAR